MRDYYRQVSASTRYRDSRRKKAKLIADVIGELLDDAQMIIDLGSGTGLIKQYLSQKIKKPILGIEVDPDFIVQKEDTAIGTVTELPVKDNSVDLVLCNHLYEHVQERSALFSEMRRVLAPSGRIYLTVGNRFQLMEPHYRLPFLSWCPVWLANTYLRVTRRGSDYRDIHFPTYGELVRAVRAQCLEADDITFDVLFRRRRLMSTPLRRVLLWVLLRLPDRLRRVLLRWLTPQWFLLLHHQQAGRTMWHGS